MSQTIDGAVQQAIDTVAAVDGIRYAPDYPPEELKHGDFPCVTGYTDGGTAGTITADFTQKLFTIILDLHVEREAALPHEIEEAMGYVDLVLDAILADTTLDSTVDTIGDIDFEFQVLNYGEKKTLGFRFTIKGCKIH